MSAPDDGGPAFPCFLNEEHPEHKPGMPLRDWFATNAVESDIAYWQTDAWRKSLKNITREQARYRYADAMIAARKETP